MYDKFVGAGRSMRDKFRGLRSWCDFRIGLVIWGYVDSYHFHLENVGWEDITGRNEVGVMKWK